MRSPQYWLAELDQYDNPTLIDGSHSSAEGANQAAYLIRAMKLGKPDRRFAVAKVELLECVPSSAGVNHEAVSTIRAARVVPETAAGRFNEFLRRAGIIADDLGIEVEFATRTEGIAYMASEVACVEVVTQDTNEYYTRNAGFTFGGAKQ